jgi:hypothetical protein
MAACSCFGARCPIGQDASPNTDTSPDLLRVGARIVGGSLGTDLRERVARPVRLDYPERAAWPDRSVVVDAARYCASASTEGLR